VIQEYSTRVSGLNSLCIACPLHCATRLELVLSAHLRTRIMTSQDALREKFLNGPALAPPPGVVAGFDQPRVLSQAALYGIAVMMFILATSTVAIRVYTKAFMVKKLSIDDCKYSPE
jgi:hypothetical protein